ncbi:MAG TPA: anhydro-N-acetylmuramic acid kinase [Chromatiales bacterium]|nr:anhydro-N-acetylmuramic acid kinase [Chromatiales bacterium]
MPLYIGLLSGTSMDGVDACLVDYGSLAPRVLGTHHRPYPAPLLNELRALASPHATQGVQRMGRLDAWLGEFFAESALHLLELTGTPAAEVRAIGSHGQTLWHAPHDEWPHTLQIADPHRIAERTGITVVADFRRRDVAAGGQGAPLVPPAHAALFGRADEARIVANIGGISNITVLPRGSASSGVWGFDTGPGNTLMDAWIHRHKGMAFDRDGAWAGSGRVGEDLLERLLADLYFTRPAPKSTGPEHFNLDWLEARGAGLLAEAAPEDVQATLLELTARTLVQAAQDAAPEAERLLVCGGGAYNPVLMQRMQALAGTMHVESTAAHGVEPAWVEALAFAWLARQTMEGLPGNLPRVTGARGERILGAIYPAMPA